MAAINWTEDQRRAIETIDRSVLVSAAAGSGKTAVLAARCAYVISDAAPPARCDVDRLLVVTFTEAAAAEMKSRIRRALAERHAQRPDDHRLRIQLGLIDAAQISTLDAFCLWMLRRWFHRAGIDATAQVLDGEEAELLKTEVYDELFNELYERPDGLGPRFRTLVDAYGLGSDRMIAVFLRSLAEYAMSRPDADDWLAMCRDDSAARVEQIITATREWLRREMFRQTQHTAAVARLITARMPKFAFYAEKIAEYARRLQDWRAALGVGSPEAWDSVAADISEYELSSKGSPRLAKDCPDKDREDRDRARDLFDEVKARLLVGRLQKSVCRFTDGELRDGIGRTMPFAATLAELAEAFINKLDRTKRSLGVIDFADLERLAYRLLTETQEGESVSPIAAELRTRFHYVLVDEYQDINPMQAAILRLVSRDEQRGMPGNLFTVGDVKQSIYRFRLAEPSMFLERERALRANVGGCCIDLQKNFRSAPKIIEAVNAIFGRLMQSEAGGVAYDERAALKHPDPEAPSGPPVEIHVLERSVEREAEEEEKETPRFVDLADPTQWTAVEREAFFIGRRIQALMASGEMVPVGDTERPLRYRDVCVLLRSTKHSADRVARMLNRMGVPAWADSSGGLFDSLEVRDILSLLSVMDNRQQDIPLAAVLRAGILGEALTADELIEIKTVRRYIPFHEAVREYARRGAGQAFRKRLDKILRRLTHYREQARVRPLADVLWEIYRETGYLGYVGGLRGGDQRRANLLALHERARQFGNFRRQGLRRFLEFIEALQEQGEDLGSASPVGESEDVVRIISIHRAKGLEYPVVIAAEIGRQFNLGDTRGRMLFAREVGIGLKAVDRERLIEYPTAAHQWCARATDEASRAEELRVWYVAMTRASRRLILVGTAEHSAVERYREAGAMSRVAGDTGALSPLAVLTARSPLQWIASACGHMPDDRVSWGGIAIAGHHTLFEVALHDAEEIQDWRLSEAEPDKANELLAAVAKLAPLPAAEPISKDRGKAEHLLDGLDYTYPGLAVSSVRVAWAASEAKAAYSQEVGNEPGMAPARLPRGVALGQLSERSDAVRRGQVTHKALQFVGHEKVGDATSIAAQVRRLVSEGVLAAEDAELIDAEALAWFFATELGQRVRTAGKGYRREWMFLASEPASLFDPTIDADGDERVLVRGVVDGVLDCGQALEVVDFKTDSVADQGVEARAAEYAMQMQLYASAVRSAFGRPVRAAHLVFLAPRRIIVLGEDRL